jgi:hypothetical protein
MGPSPVSVLARVNDAMLDFTADRRTYRRNEFTARVPIATFFILQGYVASGAGIIGAYVSWKSGVVAGPVIRGKILVVSSTGNL